MAAKKNTTQAEKAVSDAKKKSSGGKSGSGGQKSGNSGKKSPAVKTEYDRALPSNAVIAMVSLGLFIFFLVSAVKPDGALLRVVLSIMLGLLGDVGFYFLIPALLYLFCIHTFGRKTKVRMRAWCTLAFVLLCGCFYHLTLPESGLSKGIAIFRDLFMGGINGDTGGVICGGIGAFLRWFCGDVISYIFLVIGAVLTLLGAMQITIFSIARAIQNRPRDEEEEDEDDEEDVDPAAIVVNHIATRHIEHNRQKRQRLAVANQPVVVEEPVPGVVAVPAESVPAQATKQAAGKQPRGTSDKAKDMMSQIDDISSPVVAAAEHVSDTEAEPVPAMPVKSAGIDIPVDEPAIPTKMPPLELDEPIAPAPKLEREPEPAPASTEKPKPAQSSAKPGKVTAQEAAESAQQVAEEIAQAQAVQRPEYCFPPIDLLNRPSRGAADGTTEMKENSRRLNETLASFKIDAHIINVTRGPSVTRYEVELDKGVRLNKLTSCADDIALSLGASGVRIAAVPGKISIVGIEVPNRAVTTVSLREVIDSPEFHKSKSRSSFAVGKDIGGSCIIGNIAKMPHMLIAGTTGSGKSVCMNSLIISLLYKAGPEDVKLIMVDPKMVELANYNGIPHLMIPVVTDPKKAAGALQWAVTEMMRRYKTMSDAGVRDLESFNSIVQAEGGVKLPQLIVIIDELADLMLVAAKEVEDSICRIAQMGRAAGIHLVIATQRPSADVITGLMKANIPSRIAFSVASAMESRIILDTIGAEKLVGKGDMLFAPIGCGKPLRVQGCFVTDAEVEAVTSYVKENYVADYDQQVLEEIEKKAQQTDKKSVTAADPDPTTEELDGDEMLPAAVDVILETGQASVSMLQRRLKLGYARAARIVDEMEEKGIVGPFQGSKPRTILITKEQWAAQRGAQPQQLGFEDLEEDTEPVPEDF